MRLASITFPVFPPIFGDTLRTAFWGAEVWSMAFPPRTAQQVDRDLVSVLRRRDQAKREISRQSLIVIDCTRRIAELIDERTRIMLPQVPDTPEGIPG
jgi:hypothetical protein